MRHLGQKSAGFSLYHRLTVQFGDKVFSDLRNLCAPLLFRTMALLEKQLGLNLNIPFSFGLRNYSGHTPFQSVEE